MCVERAARAQEFPGPIGRRPGTGKARYRAMLEDAPQLVDEQLTEGTGARRQRHAFRTGGLPALLDLIAAAPHAARS